MDYVCTNLVKPVGIFLWNNKKSLRHPKLCAVKDASVSRGIFQQHQVPYHEVFLLQYNVPKVQKLEKNHFNSCSLLRGKNAKFLFIINWFAMFVTVKLPWAKVAAISNDFLACNCAFPKFYTVLGNFLCGNKRLLLLLKLIRVFEVNRIEATTKWILKVFRFDQISDFNL